jgi:class 3 adenylate cyclase
MCRARRSTEWEATLDEAGSIPRRRFWFATIWLMSVLVVVGASLGFFLSASRARVEVLKETELHALGMRTDALQTILRQAVADLLLVSSQGPLLSFLNGAEQDATYVEQELLALAGLHPEYGQLSVIPTDGRPAIRVTRSDVSSGPTVVPEGEGAAPPSIAPILPFANGDVFVSLVRTDEVQTDTSPSDPRALSLLVGVGVEGSAGEAAMAVTAQLPWTEVLRQYADAHPGSSSLAYLTTETSQVTFFAGSANDETGSSAFADGQSRTEAQSTLPGSPLPESGQSEIRGGLLTYATFHPEDAARGAGGTTALQTVGGSSSVPLELSWKAISWVPASTFRGVRYAGAANLIGWNMFGVMAMGMISWFGADRLARRNALHKRTTAEKSLLSSAFGRYVPKVEARRLLEEPLRYADLGGVSHEAAILFVDVRGYTHFAELHDPQRVVATLNRVLSTLTPAIRLHGGVLDKYLGDGFLAFFLALPGFADPARRAIDAACEMQRAYAELYRSASGQDLQGMGIGIGISAGQVILGNVGSRDLMDFTVIGDTVNVAARLQATAVSGEVLITESAFRAIVDVDSTERQLEIELRGRKAAVAVRAVRSPHWIGPLSDA